MMTEISLNVLDVAENSTRAGASLVTIEVNVSHADDTLTVIIKVGLGVPFFKLAAESSGGHFHIESEPGVGTTVTAFFGLSHIDRMPLGDISSTIHNLIVYHPDTDFIYIYRYDGASFTLDTREMREILGGIPLDTPEVSSYILEYLTENKQETDHGAVI